VASPFNLIHEDWIPIREGGRRDRIGLEELFSRAPEIEDLDTDSPLAWVGLFRLLLAITHRAFAGPRDFAEWSLLRELGRFPEPPITKYCERWKHKFNLFDKEFPFYQDATLRGRKGATITTLTPEAASGNNGTLFDHSCDGVETILSPSDACLALLVAQTYAVGGRIASDIANEPGELGSTSGALLAGRLIFPIQGTSLWETLLLNLVLYDPEADRPFDANTLDPKEADTPVWERTPQQVIERAPYGYIDYLTWPSRRLLLNQLSDGSVSRVIVRSGTGLSKNWDQARWDPFMARRPSDPKKPGSSSVLLSESKALWRDSAALFGAQQDDQKSMPRNLAQLSSWEVLPFDVPVLAVGVCTDQAKFVLWRRELWKIPADLLTHSTGANLVNSMVETAEDGERSLRIRLREIAKNILLPTAPAKADKDRVTNLVKSWSVDRSYWSALGSSFWPYLRRASTDEHGKVLNDWERLVSAAKKNALRDVADSLGESHRM
jgi:CRISPR system Cascade subunit CasA